MKKRNAGKRFKPWLFCGLSATVLLLASCAGIRGPSQSAQAGGQMTERMISKIQTDVDPEFVYDYKQSKFVPEKGKTLLIMGQTVERITEYKKHFSGQPLPGGWMAYWPVTEIAGVWRPGKNETGSTQDHQMLADAFPNTVIQSAMWMVGKWGIAKNAGEGLYDAVIKEYSTWANSVDRPIYLRIGYEFDGLHNELEPEEYVRAYRRIVDLMRAKGVDNVAFVWHSYASRPYGGHPLSAWYPGDDYVDWVAISVFEHAYGGPDFGSYCNEVLAFAKAHHKPVMIAESCPIRGIDRKGTKAWDQWFAPYFTFIYNKNIKAISFINEDWPRTAIEGVLDWKDARLSNNKQIARAWFEETGKDRYLKQSAALFRQLGYEE